jgi:lipoyl(octanoyl) transferase
MDGPRLDTRTERASWRLVVTEPASGAWNMACDEVLGDAVIAGTCPSVVRFFQWTPPTISFGYSQRISHEVDLHAAQAGGVGVVRRVTGGRAVLHSDEITYSIICRENAPIACGGITATYVRVSEGLAAGLRKLGIDAHLARASDPTVPLRDRQAAVPCFGSTTRAEVVVNGRKLIGSAQHRMRGLMIQHGSILVGPHHRTLVNFLNAEPELRDRYARRLESSTTSIREAGWDGTDRAEIIPALAAGIEETLSLGMVEEALTRAESDAIERLAETKYAADWWNYPDPSQKPDRNRKGAPL